eukprot:Em0195g2a
MLLPTIISSTGLKIPGPVHRISVAQCDGIGRTGTFCAAYSMMDRVKVEQVEQVVDAFQTIKSMRIQRAGLLDSLAQYIFLHSALLEFLSTFDAYQNFK